jgi:Zn-dependent M28 family amino/carboxypeptidase
MSFSPVTPNSTNHLAFIGNVSQTLEGLMWDVTLQNWTLDNGVNSTNILAVRQGNNSTSDPCPLIIVGAHYDTRLWADKDPDIGLRQTPVPGANDGGSGVAVILELARVLQIPSNYEVWLVFFDVEDQGGIPGWVGGSGGWIIGSTYFVNQMSISDVNRTIGMVLLDMVGGQDLIIQQELSSDTELRDKVWETAHTLGLNDTFTSDIGLTVTDDHTPFLQAGIPAINIIQQRSRDGYTFFKWHHTTNDTLANIESISLGVVGETVEYLIENEILSDTPTFDLWGLLYQVLPLTVIIVGPVIVVIYWIRKQPSTLQI